jgi:hypothetical protein
VVLDIPAGAKIFTTRKIRITEGVSWVEEVHAEEENVVLVHHPVDRD